MADKVRLKAGLTAGDGKDRRGMTGEVTAAFDLPANGHSAR
jgi:hypothetical protein